MILICGAAVVTRPVPAILTLAAQERLRDVREGRFAATSCRNEPGPKLLGLAHGYLNGTGMSLSVPSVVAAFGLAAAVFVLVVLVAAPVVQLRVQWARIAVRVAGSWIAAMGLLMLGWSIRGV